MTSRWSVPSPCGDLSTNKSLSLTIGYIGEVCKNNILTFIVVDTAAAAAAVVVVVILYK